MPTAQGSVRQVGSASRIKATFTVGDGREFYYDAVFTVPGTVPMFNSPIALLTYATEGDLTGQQEFTGVLGPVTLAMTIGTATTVAGPIDENIDPPLPIKGRGSWTST